MRDGDVIIEELPIGGADAEERRIFGPKGEMAQVLNREDESFRQLVYWDLDTTRTGAERGHHRHERKTDRIYVIAGELEFIVEDPKTLERRVFAARAGSRITIAPGLAHTFRSRAFAQAIEWSSAPYDPSDTHPHRITGW